MYSDDFIEMVMIFAAIILGIAVGLFVFLPTTNSFETDCHTKHGVVKQLGSNEYCVINGQWVKK